MIEKVLAPMDIWRKTLAFSKGQLAELFIQDMTYAHGKLLQCKYLLNKN